MNEEDFFDEMSLEMRRIARAYRVMSVASAIVFIVASVIFVSTGFVGRFLAVIALVVFLTSMTMVDFWLTRRARDHWNRLSDWARGKGVWLLEAQVVDRDDQ